MDTTSAPASINFYIKDARDSNGKAIMLDHLPDSYKAVGDLITSLGLADKVKAGFELCCSDFWRSAKDFEMGPSGWAGCMGRPGKCPCQSCSPKPITPVDAKYCVLVITYNLARKPEGITSLSFNLTRGPRDNIIHTISVMEVACWKKFKVAVVPTPETLECLALMQKRNPKMSIMSFCAVSDPYGYESKEGKFNQDFVDFVWLEEDESIPPDSIAFFSRSEPERGKETYDIKFQMFVSDLKCNMPQIEKFLTMLACRESS